MAAVLGCLAAGGGNHAGVSHGHTFLRMQIDPGGVDIELFDSQAPLTAANFLNYVNRGDCDGTFIRRSVPEFVVQGGGYLFNPANGDFFASGTSHMPVDPPVVHEPDPVNGSNVRAFIDRTRIT